MNFFSKLISKPKLFIPLVLSIIVIILYQTYKVSVEKKIHNVKEESRYEEPDFQMKTDTEEKPDEKKEETKEIVKDKLDKKQIIKEKKEIKPKKKRLKISRKKI